jgi:hypothetical protein
MDKFVLRGEAAKAATESRQRRQQPNAPPPQRQLRIDDLRATVVLPTSNLHPDPEELLRLSRVVRNEGESEREVSRALLALGAYDVSARDLEGTGGAVASAVRWRRGHGPGHGPPAPGGMATRSPELAAALLAKWRGRVLEDARRARKAARRDKGSLRGFVVTGGGDGGGGGGGPAAGGTGLEEDDDEVEDDDD